MKLTTLVLVGLVLGMAGYWWATSDAPSTGTSIDRALALASARRSPGAATAPGTIPAAGTGARTVAAAGTIPSPAEAPASAATPPAPVPASPTDAGLLLPLPGLTRDQLHDTFTDARSEGRVHDAIDIMAPAGTPVLAVADGTVEKLFDSKRGGLTIYQFEPSGRYAYYYAHLQRYADGLAEKQAIRRGQVIGYVGSTGNADPGAPHLHFAIFHLGPERHWWEGEAINPYPVLHDGQDP